MAKQPGKKEADNKPINILLVEDSDADIKIALRAFAKVKLKNNIYVVHDGQEALDFIYHKAQYEDTEKYPVPDLILLDINMPKLNGFEVLKAIKNDLNYSYIPVIMLTSSQNEKDIATSYRFGAASYIPKPVCYDNFVEIVDGFTFYWRSINKLPRRDMFKE